MKRLSTLTLRSAIFLIGAGILAICLFVLPSALIHEDDASYRLLICVMYAAAIPFFAALYQALRILGFIDRGSAFSDLSVRALKIIKYCAFAISAIYLPTLPVFYAIAQEEDAPGVMAIGLIIIFASVIIGVFAAVLQMLLHSAIEMKTENELTV